MDAKPKPPDPGAISPAPWSGDGYSTDICDADGKLIARVVRAPDHALMLAAPDMLRVLSNVAEEIREKFDGHPEVIFDGTWNLDATTLVRLTYGQLQAILVAVAKAKGAS